MQRLTNCLYSAALCDRSKAADDGSWRVNSTLAKGYDLVRFMRGNPNYKTRGIIRRTHGAHSSRHLCSEVWGVSEVYSGTLSSFR